MAARRADILVGLGAAVCGIGFAALEQAHVAGWLAGAAVGGAFALARRSPRAAWVTAAVALGAATPFGPLPTGVELLAVVHAFCAGRGDGRWWGVAGLIAIVGALELDAFFQPDDSGVPALLLPAAAWGGGRALRERELVAAQLAERARELEEEREAHAALSVRYERARIAAELHDIVAHAISVMVIQASAGQRLAPHDPEATAETFDAIAGAARQAEEDMGRLVALLGDECAIGPPPDVALVEELVARASGSGLDVKLRLEGEREGWPAELAEVAYRVVQEGLTNALRYAAGAAVTVLVRGDADTLTVEVRNAPAAGEAGVADLGTGTGLRGLRERVGACGGTLEAGPTSEGGWLLGVRMPRRVTAQAG
jgi:signal transduction histidine kinase